MKRKENVQEFLRELQVLCDKHKIYVDGFYVSSTQRDVIEQQWTYLRHSEQHEDHDDGA